MMLSELDVEALHSGPAFLTADTLGPLLDHCDALFGLSSLEEPLSPTSSVHSHHAPLPEAKGSDLMLPWLGASDLLDIEYPQEEDDALLAMDWVSEKLELNELDLDSLLDSSDDRPDSPDATLAPQPDPAEPQPDPAEPQSDPAEPQSDPAVPQSDPAALQTAPEAVVKSEPLELGSEVDLTELDSDSDSGIESSPPHTPQSCRSKPYSRSQPNAKPNRPVKTVERKMKKMEQNKTAATRYRQKKKVEQEELHTERLLLEKKNQELTERTQAISREIKYLKDLMEDVRRHHQNKSRTAAK
ncbi:cyclic AMP-dependent transcription factor ATF-4 [Eucyclogobius newberryi]|uniref:cyclic AMP-dependent transcription factor ATF-4 n=1 Tax=Eucyclogobius newberryi TaxID=166745 RepID=UPI003B5A4649